MSQVQYSKFTSIDHLTQYILNSNRFPTSQLFGEFGLDFRGLNQIQSLVDKSKQTLKFSSSNAQTIKFTAAEDFASKQRGLEDISKKNFWEDLIKLYLLHFHLNLPVFNLPSTTAIFNLPQPLLISIYCWGYICRKRKTPQLTEYMDKLAHNNVNRIIFKPSLSNCQALYIQYYNYYRRGKIREGRACINHLTRMCYSLGLHLDSQLFHPQQNYNRSNLFLNILCSQKNINTVYMVFPGFEYELENWNTNLFNPEWYRLPLKVRNLLNLSDGEDELFSRLSALKNRSKVEYLAQIKFPPNLAQYTNDQIEKICLLKLQKLKINYFNVYREYEALKSQFNSRCSDLSSNLEMVTLHYLQSSLLILEYGRLKSNPPTPTLLTKTVNILDEILSITLSSSTNYKNYLDLNYLVGFTYLQIFGKLDYFKRREVFEKYEKLIEFNMVGDYQLLQYLVLCCGFKLISK
jgi:hypothetical protein